MNSVFNTLNKRVYGHGGVDTPDACLRVHHPVQGGHGHGDTLEVFRCGHPRSPENIYPRKGGKADECRLCRNEKKRAYRKTPAGEIAQLKAWIKWAEARIAELEVR